MSTAALKLALEALEYFTDTSSSAMDKAMAEDAITAIKAALEAKDGCQCPACKVAPHASDCAVHNEPAHPAGECNCGASGEPVAWRWGAPKLKHGTFEWRYSLNKTRPDSIPLYAAPQKQPPVIDKSVARRIATQLGWEPPRKPLREEMVKQMKLSCDSMEMRGAFADGWLSAEAAHGIKGEA